MIPYTGILFCSFFLFLIMGFIVALLKKSKKYALIFGLSFLGIIALIIAFIAVHISYNDGQM